LVISYKEDLVISYKEDLVIPYKEDLYSYIAQLHIGWQRCDGAGIRV